MDVLRVGIAEYRLAEAPATLVARGLGSCLAILLYDEAAQRGALAHALLPVPREGHTSVKPATYVNLAIAEMVEKLAACGSPQGALVAKLVGGSQMFLSTHERLTPIGELNLSQAIEVLAQMQIPVVGQETGGNQGRSLEFDLASGSVAVMTVRSKEPKLL
ncbi:MAG: hypothetical protein C0624_01965 [Desulfuromonas sp.]|nr:MAG: hypothetical protein C0624_01965 [Desulfuromonas sp.]